MEGGKLMLLLVIASCVCPALAVANVQMALLQVPPFAQLCCPESQKSLDAVNSKLDELSAKLEEIFDWLSSQHGFCPRGFTYLPLAKSCYKVVFESHDWDSATKKCQNFRRGAHLIAISSEAENQAVTTFLASELSNSTACLSLEWPQLGNFLWTSGQRPIENRASPFQWKLESDRQLPIEFTNWLPGEPSNTQSEYCVHMWASNNFGWNDIQCGVKICPVCEFNP